jgi:Tfp pilus assembly protein FimT
MAAIAAPRYRDSLSRYRTDAAARRIAADFSFAQARARASSTTRSVSFDSASSIYCLSGEQNLNFSTGTYSVNLTSEPYYVSISTLNLGGNTSVTFNGYGVPSCSGYVQIGAGSASRKISIDPDTGAASIQ